ncbi:MAG: hypothetical protein HYU64_13640, partial [Armatimonadetes bacterium]|nr:hypothetical protein [Armatimonadota bacterium]
RSDGTINRTGKTSKLSFDFWAMRGMWALASGYEVFRSLDPPYAVVLKKHFDTALKQLKETISHSPHGLPNNATDQGSQALLALCVFYQALPRDDIKALIEQLADRIVSAQGKNPGEFPFRSYPSIIPGDGKPPSLWHAWGSRQMMALALSGKLLRRPDWIRSAEREANHWTVHVLATRGNLHGMNPDPVLYPEQPYGMEVTVQGLVQLYRSTKKDHWSGRFLVSWKQHGRQSDVRLPNRQGL